VELAAAVPPVAATTSSRWTPQSAPEQAWPPAGCAACRGCSALRRGWCGVDPEQLRRSVAVIYQDFLHYALPTRDNIGLGRHEHAHDLAAVTAAARQAGAHEFLTRLPDGYDTVLGPEFRHGKDLSVGQWQRVALARAFFRDVPFVILDEPTAAPHAPRRTRPVRRRTVGAAHLPPVLQRPHRRPHLRPATRLTRVPDPGRPVFVFGPCLPRAAVDAVLASARVPLSPGRP
jgi:hypothetical protein